MVQSFMFMKQILIQLSIKGQNKYEEVKIWLDKAFNLDPKHIYSLSEKGRLDHIQINRLMFMKILLFQLPIMAQNKCEEAIIWMDKALNLNPKHVFSLSNKGRLNHMYINRLMFIKLLLIKLNLTLLKKYADALKYFDQALSLNLNQAFSLEYKGQCLCLNNYFRLQIQDQQKYKEALIYYEKSLIINPNDEWTKKQKIFARKN